MNYDFAKQYMEPKRTGNLLRDLNPLSKADLLLVLGLSPFIVQNFIYGFAMVILFILISAAAGCFRSFFSLYWKVLLLFGVFLFLVKAAFSPGEHVIYQIWGICVTTESIPVGTEYRLTGAGFQRRVHLVCQDDAHGRSDLHAGAKRGVPCGVLCDPFVFPDHYRPRAEREDHHGIPEGARDRDRRKCAPESQAYIPVMGPLVLNAISSTEEKSIAMDARAFSAPVEHTFLSELPKVSGKEKALVILFDLAFVALIAGRIVSCIL